MSLALRFLGVGSAQAPELGSACGVIESAGMPVLMIDCGPEALAAYLAHYQVPPRAIYITHTHMDHVAGLERLFYTAYFDDALRGHVRLYAHAALVPLLQARIADYPEVIAEGGANFWDAFRLIPCSRGFWCDGFWFGVFATRHHAPNTSFGLSLAGSMVWTGDTRPIPEALAASAASGELVAHDCALHGNPSHTGLDDLEREYPQTLRDRLMLYHYASESDARAMESKGWRVARSGDVVVLPMPRRHGAVAAEVV